MRNKRFNPTPLQRDKNDIIDFRKKYLPSIPKVIIEEEIKPSAKDRKRLKDINDSLIKQHR